MRNVCCGSLLPVFGVIVSVTFHLMFVHINFSSVKVAEKNKEGVPFLLLLSGHLMGKSCSLR